MADLVIATKSVLQKRVLGIEIPQNFLGGSAPGPPASPIYLHQLPLLGRTCCRVLGGVPPQWNQYADLFLKGALRARAPRSRSAAGAPR